MAREGRNRRQSDFPEGEVPGRYLPVRCLMSLPAQEVMRLKCVGWEWPLIVHRLDSLIPEGHPVRPYLDRFIGSAVEPGVHRAPPRKKTR